MNSLPLLECRNLAFERDDLPLFSGVGFTLFPGCAIQVTGGNGVGKTTLLRMLAGALTPSEGEILWQGESTGKMANEYRSSMLYLGHDPAVKQSLSPKENLQWYFRLFPSNGEELQQALNNVKLAGYEDVPCHTLSAGQHRRVALARLYLTAARLWILDEPFTSIDVNGVAQLEALMAQHLERGGAIIMTTHQQLRLSGVEQFQLESYSVEY